MSEVLQKLPIMLVTPLASQIAERAEILLQEQQLAVYKRTDKLFVKLLILEYFAGIAAALILSPKTWSGMHSAVHLHVWAAVILGAVIVSRPIYLAYRHSGETATRHTIAIAQMLYSALWIHLTGGRIEAHFHIFGSLAFLSFYRDWRVLVSASAVVMIDHIVRGLYFPQSIYGVSFIEPLRWLEHTLWVVFEDIFLIKSCRDNVIEMKAIANRQAEVEETRDNVEELVKLRTSALINSEHRLATRYAVTKSLTRSASLEEAAHSIVQAVARGILPHDGLVASIVWAFDDSNGQVKKIGQFKLLPGDSNRPQNLGQVEARRLADLDLFNLIKNNPAVVQIQTMDKEVNLTNPQQQKEVRMGSAFAFPLMAGDRLMGVIEVFAESAPALEDAEVSMLRSLGQQIGDFAVKMQMQSKNLELAHMVHWSGDAIIGQTIEGIITSWNYGAEKFFEYTEDEIKGKHISCLAPTSTLLELEQFMLAGKSGDTVEGIETQRMSKSGKLLDVSVTRSPVFDERNRIVGISEVMHNIAERKEAENRVSEFYSIVSHELRTPLTSIRGVLGLIEGGIVEAGSDEAGDLLTVARESTDRLIRLINDMLDLKKIEAGKMVLQKSFVPVNKLVEDCLDSLTGMCEGNNVKLRRSIRCRKNVFVDPDKATQILTNLISNAIKFSPAYSDVTVIAEATDSGMVRFKVVDHGPGISLVDQKRLFEKFQQLDASDSRAQSGSGLGLAITRALVKEHGGSIGVESTPGEGSTFWFDLPEKDESAEAEITQTAPQENVQAEQQSESNDLLMVEQTDGGKRVLLVEDDGPLAKMLTAHFEKTGYQTSWAATIKDARQALSQQSFALMVLDLGLPDGSGLDLLSTIKSCEETAMLPVIVITGQTIDDRYIANATVADWLAKPFNSDSLVKVLDRVTGNVPIQEVLIADEDTGARQALGNQIKARGLNYIEARDSSEIITLTNLKRPDMIIMDVSMASQQAMEKLKALRLQSRDEVDENGNHTRYVPIVVYASHNLTEEQKKELNLGNTILLNEEEGQNQLMDTVSALLGGICK